MYALLLQGITLGFAAGIQPGPFQTYLITQSLGQGWRKSWPAAIGPLVSDGPIVALVLLVLSQVPEWFQRVLAVGGGLFILYLAWGAFQRWRHFSEQTSAVLSGPQSLLRAALMNFLSPSPYIFWSLVNGPILMRAWEQSLSNAIAFVGGFYAAMLGINLTVILVTSLAGQTGERVRRALLGFSVLALAAFGLFQLWSGLAG